MLKKKFGIVTLVCLLCLSVAMLFAACSGTQGEKGDKGESGADGKDGISIVSVEKTDSKGLTDTYTITYSDGKTTTFTVTNGKDGVDGSDGEDGTDGETPHIGENGNWWIGSTDTKIPAKGQDGQDGTDGITPHIGENGNWFIGDKDTGILAEGQSGSDGKDGISITDAKLNGNGELVLILSDGSKIPVGSVVGADGTTPHIGANGNWWIGEKDTGISAKGQDGQDGNDGEDGADGITPHIGENGNWFIGEEDTGISAKGQDGSDGKNGVSITGARIENGILYLIFTDDSGSSEREIGQVTGENGADGQDGKSAYELYKDYHPEYMGDEAQWLYDLANGNLAEVETHTVTFSDIYGGSPIPSAQEVKHGEKLARPKDPTREGYIFDGWYYKGEKWSFIGYIVTENMVLSARWIQEEEEESCAIVSADGFEFGWEEVNAQQVQTISKKLPNNVTAYDLASQITVSKGCTWRLYKDYGLTDSYYSKTMTDLKEGNNEAWLIVSTSYEQTRYKVNLHRRFMFKYEFRNENTVLKSGTIEEDSFIETAPETIPTKTGYTFSHWAVNGEQVTFPYTVTFRPVFNAVFTPNSNTLHFDGNDATDGTMEDMTIATGTTVNLPKNNFERKGYAFKGWQTSEGYFVKDQGSYTMGTETEYTLYAIWEIITYSITYNTDGGRWEQGSKPSTFTIEDFPVKLTFEPVIKNDHAFFGWYTEKDFSGEAITEYTISEIGDITFYAKLLAGTEDLQYIEKIEEYVARGYVIYQYSGSETDIVIPDYHDSRPVLSIQGDGSSYPYTSAFENGINSITFGINTQLTSIGDYAFANCSGLTNIEIPSGVTSIGDYAFYGCSGLTNIEIPSGVTTISDYAFFDCSSLTNIKIPNGVTTIGEYAFYGCSSLTNIEIPSGVTSIGDYAFSYSGLTSMAFCENSQLKSIGDSAFENCYGLNAVYISDWDSWFRIQFVSDYSNPLSHAHNLYLNGELVNNLVIPDDTPSIGNYVFSGGDCLTSIEIPSSVTSIGNSAFYGCSSLTSVIFGKNSQLTSIGNSAFDGCNSLTNIEIPSSVTNISSYAFYGCRKLMNIKIPSRVTSISNYTFYGCNNLTSVEIPSSVTAIGGAAFYKCSSLASIELPSDVTFIGSHAFSYCSGLTSIEIPSGITSIGESLFGSCSSLTSVTFEENSQLTTIGREAFYGCNGLTSIEIPSSVTSIDDYAFDGCAGLQGVYIADIEAWCKIDFDSSMSNPLRYAHNLYLNGELVTNYVFPDNTTSISNYVFAGGNCLTSIKIPNSVTSIGSGAFYGCNGLTSIEIPSSVTSIGSYAFYDCSGLTSIEIPSSVTSIDYYAFYGCSGLTSIKIPNSVTSIGSGAFSGCSSLTSIEIPSGVTSIGYSAFYGCSGLTSIVIPSNVASIGESAFSGCRSLTSIEIPSSVTSIGHSTFDGCSSLDIVYYGGVSQSEWDDISIGSYNTYLTSATRYYYSENKPPLNEDGTAYDGNYWHYVDGVPTIWVKEQ